jgi:hypothetical protein
MRWCARSLRGTSGGGQETPEENGAAMQRARPFLRQALPGLPRGVELITNESIFAE